MPTNSSRLLARYEAGWAVIADNNVDICTRRAPQIAASVRAAGAKCDEAARGWKQLSAELASLPALMHDLSRRVNAACAQCEALEHRLLEATVARAEVREARWRQQQLLDAEAAEAKRREDEEAEARRLAEAEAEAKRKAEAERQRALQVDFETQRKAYLEAGVHVHVAAPAAPLAARPRPSAAAEAAAPAALGAADAEPPVAEEEQGQELFLDTLDDPDANLDDFYAEEGEAAAAAAAEAEAAVRAAEDT